MGGDVCGDDRFEIIEQAKKALLESTNIKDSPNEMEVLDSFLFRCWQMGWLNKYKPGRYAIMKDKDGAVEKVEIVGKLEDVEHSAGALVIIEDEFLLKMRDGEIINYPESCVELTPISYEQYEDRRLDY